MVNPILLSKLRKLDEVILLELLGVTSTDLVDKFLDVIEEREDYINGQVGEEDL